MVGPWDESFLLYGEEGEYGTLRCHVSKANPQWQALESDAAALVVFQGAQSYITPSWYPTKAETEKVVPTWNYAIVQARGPATVIHEAAWLHANVSALTAQNEGKRPKPWAVTDAPEPFIASQLKGIVGVLQNAHPEDRRAIYQELNVSIRYHTDGRLHVKAGPSACTNERVGGGL